MEAITSIGTFIFGLFNFGILWLLIYSSFKKGRRDSFVSAALYSGVFLWGLAEFLSLFNCLTFGGILSGCIVYDICIILLLFSKYRRKILSTPELRISHLKHWEFYFIGGVLIITFFLALAYPPNNWDSMTYHLPRIEHWIQNGNLDHYYTSIS
ncbi:MAG: hypothetical protein LBL79_00500 [Prevotella sp.]|jgi:hypothetical protein|nr:hypothetical protein [Prevotella sp.]